MRKKYLGIVFSIALTVVTTGCGSSFPELTETQYNQTVEYAVGLLMKYSNNEQEKLVYVNAKEEQKAREKAARKAEEEEAEKKAQEQASTSTPAPAPTPTPATTTTDNSDTTEQQADVSETQAQQAEETSTQETETTKAEKTDPDAIVLSADETQEIIEDIFISYEGYSVSRTYPESSKSYVINADKGKKLLVLRFDLYNGSDSAKKVNILQKNILFQVLLNNKNIGYTAVTVLPNDLSSYVGTIESRAHESLVVLAEIKESESTSIESLGLIVTMGGKDQTVYLK
jgi:hypothetical protein